jgi:ribosomal protein L11 methyltransferase
VQPGDTVADLGAGSAVLAIAAARLGARRVAAIEMDPDAIGNAELNVVRNDVADRVTVLEGDAAVLLPLVAPVRVILANIISSVITALLPTIGAALEDGGALILSGVLVTERAALLDVLERAGWAVEADDVEGEWWSALARRA